MIRALWILLLLIGATLACNLSSTPPPTPTAEPTKTPIRNPTATAVPPSPTSSLPTLEPTPTSWLRERQVNVTPGGGSSVGGQPVSTQDSFNGCPPKEGWVIYTVIPGDTLGQIARRYSTTTRELVEANCMSSADLVYVGQRLQIPSPSLPRSPTPSNNPPQLPTLGS